MRRALILLVLILGALWAAPASAQPCTGLCLQQVTCPSGPNGGTTSISGRVLAPNGNDPLPNVLVYVPNSPVLPFESGAVCTAGGQQASGSPLVETTTAVDGTFRLTNMPVGPNIPVVIQAGKWRRQFVVPNVQACASTPVPQLMRFPRNKIEGDIPKIAIVTGAVDAIECALRKIGIQDSEFGNPGSTSRIQIYKGSGNAGAIVNNFTPPESQLFANQSNLNQYDMTMLACQGNQYDRNPADRQRLVNYTNAGGRVFATHYEYSWLYNTAPFSGTANWDVNQPNIPDQNARVNTSFPKGAQLSQWLQVVGASPAAGVIPLQAIRHDQNGVIPPTQSWLSVNDQVAGLQSVQFTFNTPVGVPADQQCGRVLFNEYHVENVNDSSLMQFPTACSAGPMTAQEKLLEYMLFDLSTFVAPDIPATVSVSFTNAPPTFTQGDAADQTVINVTNTKPTLATDATLTLTAAIPNGLTAVSMAGLNPATTRWACSVATASCTRTAPLAGGATDPISLILAVAPNAPVGSGPVVLSATASGGGLAANVVADNPITIRGLATLAWGAPALITYGTGLDGTQLNAQGNVPGTYVYSPPAGTVLNAGTHPLNVTFTPNDTINYPNSPTATVQIEVDRATPSLTWTTPSPIVYGTPLSATQLSATANVPGAFSYSPVTGAVLNAGSQPLNVTFTPTDTTNYAGASGGVTLLVTQATPLLNWATPSPIVYGTPLSATQLSASTTVPGAFSYSQVSGAVLTAGSQLLNVTFTPDDTTNYAGASGSVTLLVTQATPVLTWPTPSPIVYGTPLSATQLSATTDVAGAFSYSQVTGAVLTAGPQPLNVTFTPTDTTNYAGATAGVTLLVNQATPSLTWATPSPIVYGTPLSATQLSAVADVAGAFSYLPPAGTVLNAGANQRLDVRFAPTDSVNYKTVSANVSVNVVASPAVINGMPLAASCSIWPPNGKLVQVATIGASATAGGVQSFSVTATSNEPVGSGDIVIAGSGVGPRTVQLRAARAGKNSGRIYTITATATNIVGAVTTATTTCTVPHDQSR